MKNWVYKNVFLKYVRPAFRLIGLDLVAFVPPVNKRAVHDATISTLRKIEAWTPERDPSVGEHIIWQFWWQGEDSAPPLIRRCLESVRRHSKGWQVVVIDERNISQYLDIPPYIAEKHRSGVITHTHFSDYLRAKLLQKHGGVWIDATVLLTDDIPDDILTAKSFVFKTSLWASDEDVPDRESFLSTIETAGRGHIGGGECACSSWFLVAWRDSALMSVVARALEWYWRDAERLVDYFLFHFFVSYAVAANEFCRREFVGMPRRVNVKPHMLLFKLYEPFDAVQWKQIRAQSAVHKLSHKGNDSVEKSDTYLEAILSGRLTEE